MKSGNDKFEFYSNLVLAGSHHYTLPTVAAAPCLVVEIYEPVSEFNLSTLPPRPAQHNQSDTLPLLTRRERGLIYGERRLWEGQ